MLNQQRRSKSEQRQAQILELLKIQGKISLQTIIDTFQCSEATARRDLDALDKAGFIIRTLGGAQLNAFPSMAEVSFQEKQEVLLLEKEKIASTAASLVQEGDIIGLTGGTTTYLISKMLKARKNITVVTNAVNIAVELADSDDIQVVVTGGVMRSKSFELCGPLAEKTVADLHIGKMFVGVDGISIEHGITTYSEQEAEIAKLLIKRSQQAIAVFDHTKVGKSSLFSIAPLQTLTACVFDELPNSELATYLHSSHIELFS